MKQDDPADWGEVARRLGGDHCASGPVYNPNSVTLRHAGWTITIDRPFVSTGEGPGTPGSMPRFWSKFRIRVPFVSIDHFTFFVRPRGWLDRISRGLGFAQFETGDAAFDRALRVRALGSTDRCAALLVGDDAAGAIECASIREQLLALAVPIEARTPAGWRDADVFKREALELHLTTPDKLTPDQLAAVTRVFRSMLDRMQAIGSLAAGDPRVTPNP